MGFDVTADAYASFMGRFSEPLARQLVDLLDPAPGDRALDVGCGPGTLTAVLADRLGASGSRPWTRPRASCWRCGRCSPRWTSVTVAAEELPFGDEVFDLATAQLVVPFMTDPVRGLSEMRRVVRRGGLVAACAWDLHHGPVLSSGGRRTSCSRAPRQRSTSPARATVSSPS